MSRVNNFTNRTGYSGVDSSPADRNSAYQDSSDIAKMVTSSSAYQHAYTLFSSESDPIWLQRLVAIPQSVSDASSTIFDDYNLSNKYEDKQDANYQYCMEQISALVSEYYNWKNSLPVTQVQQMAQAGINSAITGQGISGSEFNPQSVSTDPSQLSSTEPLDFISTIGGLVFDGAKGILSAVETFNKIGTNRKLLKQKDREQHWNMQKDLLSLGFTSCPLSSSVEDFDKWWSSSGANEAKALGLGTAAEKRLRSQVKYFSSQEAFNYLFDTDENGSIITSEAGQNLVNSLVDHELSTWKYNFELKQAKAQYDYLYQLSLDPARMAEYTSNKAKFDADLSHYQSEIARIQSLLDDEKYKAIKDWYEIAGDDRQARAILARVLMNVSPEDIVHLNEFSSFTGTTIVNDSLQPIGGIAKSVK